MELKDSHSAESSQNVESDYGLSCLSIERPSSLSVDSNKPTCRICQTSGNSQDNDLGELLVSPCDCRGSLGFVHKSCMEKWLSLRNQDSCELCHFRFVTKRRLKPLNELQFRQALGTLSNEEKGILVLGIVNFILLLIEIPFLYYVIKVNCTYFFDKLSEDTNKGEATEVYSLLLVLLLVFTLILFASSLTFTVFGFKVLRKLIHLSSEVILIIPMRPLDKSLEETV